MLWAGLLHAQLDQAITTQEMTEPWSRAQAVLTSLTTAPDRGDPERIIQAVLSVDAELTTYQSEQEQVAMRIVGDPGFSYEAAEVSLDLANELATIIARFDALWVVIGISDRADVAAARAALLTLQRKLSQRNPFERDVVGALGSGGKQQILALSARWWESVDAVDKLRAALSAFQHRVEAAGLQPLYAEHIAATCAETWERLRC